MLCLFLFVTLVKGALFSSVYLCDCDFSDVISFYYLCDCYVSNMCSIVNGLNPGVSVVRIV